MSLEDWWDYLDALGKQLQELSEIDLDNDQLIEELDNEVTEEDVDAEEWGAWLKDGERPVANYDGQR